jgi:hypothetical protein
MFTALKAKPQLLPPIANTYFFSKKGVGERVMHEKK